MGRRENPIIRHFHHIVVRTEQPDTAIIPVFSDSEPRDFTWTDPEGWAEIFTRLTGMPHVARKLKNAEEFVDSKSVRYRHEDAESIHRLVKIPSSKK